MALKKFIFLTLFVAVLAACSSKEDDAKKLGFSNVQEMMRIQSLGFNTQKDFDDDIAKRQAQEEIVAAEKKKAENMKPINIDEKYQQLIEKMKSIKSGKETSELFYQSKDESIGVTQLCYMNAGYQGKLRQNMEATGQGMALGIFNPDEVTNHRDYWATLFIFTTQEIYKIPKSDLSEILSKVGNEIAEYLSPSVNDNMIDVKKVLETNIACGYVRAKLIEHKISP